MKLELYVFLFLSFFYQDLASVDDVRSKLDSMFGLKVELRALRRTVGLKNSFEATSVSKQRGIKKSSLPPVTDQKGSVW